MCQILTHMPLVIQFDEQLRITIHPETSFVDFLHFFQIIFEEFFGEIHFFDSQEVKLKLYLMRIIFSKIHLKIIYLTSDP